MPGPVNLSFETPSGSPFGGGAESWLVTSTTGALDYALYDLGVRGYESFDTGWGVTLTTAFDVSMLEEASYDTDAAGAPIFVERFERGWAGNEGYEFDFAGLAEGASETFDDWVPDYIVEHGALESAPDETFETGWGAYATDFTGGMLEAALYGGAASYDGETFVDVREGGLVAPDPATDTLGLAGHAYAAGERVRFTGLPPAPLAPGVWYFVVNSTTDAFQVAATAGGAAIDLTGAGGGATVEGDPARYWTLVMRTI